MKLTEVSTKYGAPMGRHGIYLADADIKIEIELEKVPFIDGCYDFGGAYWGGPNDLYCAIATDIDPDGNGQREIIMEKYVRANSRDHAMRMLKEEYPNSTYLPENGSLYAQAIEVLQNLLDSGGCEEVEDIELDMDIFKDRYREITGTDYRKEV